MSKSDQLPPVVPTQEDREAAFQHRLFLLSLTADDYRAVRFRANLDAGKLDSHESVQAFARHRLAALATAPASKGGEVDALREALVPFAREADAQERVTSFSSGDCIIPRTKITIGDLRRARAALLTPTESAGDEQPGDYLRDRLCAIASICEAKGLLVEASGLRDTASIVSEQFRKWNVR